MHYRSKIYKPIVYTLLATCLTGCPPNQQSGFLRRKPASTATKKVCNKINTTLTRKKMRLIWPNLTPEGQAIITKWIDKDINSRDHIGLPLLHKLIAEGIKNKDSIPKMVSLGVDVDAKDCQGATALYHAIIWKKANLVQALITAQANVNALVDKKSLLEIAYEAQKSQEMLFGSNPDIDQIIQCFIAAGAKASKDLCPTSSTDQQTTAATTPRRLQRSKPVEKRSRESFQYNYPHLASIPTKT